jgi:hypothetical protein
MSIADEDLDRIRLGTSAVRGPFDPRGINGAAIGMSKGRGIVRGNETGDRGPTVIIVTARTVHSHIIDRPIILPTTETIILLKAELRAGALSSCREGFGETGPTTDAGGIVFDRVPGGPGIRGILELHTFPGICIFTTTTITPRPELDAKGDGIAGSGVDRVGDGKTGVRIMEPKSVPAL